MASTRSSATTCAISTSPRALSEQSDAERALTTKDVALLARLAAPFHDAYPDIDIVFYDAAGSFVATVGCERARSTLPTEIGTRHAILVHGCETDVHAAIAIAVARPVVGALGKVGTILVCLPLDGNHFKNAQAKVGVELALAQDDELRYASPGFPRTLADDATPTGAIAEAGDKTWAIVRFTPSALASAPSPVRLAFFAAFDVSDIKAIVRRHLIFALAILGAATVASLLVGWRLASRMSRALSRVNHAMQRLEQQEYVKVDVLKTGDELEDLANGFNAMVDGLMERDKLRTTMGKYMTEAVVAHLMAGEVELGGKTIEVTILFCDLRDFTTFSEKRAAQEIVGLLNEYFTEMVDCVMAEGGVVDKYIGDNIMAVFGAPVSRADDAVRAVRAAVRMRAALAKLNLRFTERGVPALRFGIGLHTDRVAAERHAEIR